MTPIPINYYPLHRSGCSLKKDSLIDSYLGRTERVYGPIDSYGCEIIGLDCEFEGIKNIRTYFQLFTLDTEIDYNSFYSLN